MIKRPTADSRIRLALPNKGRLCQPAIRLLQEAGFAFEAEDRRLFAPCQNYPLDLLFVRAEDIGEYAQDGVVDLGITGSNLIRERASKVTRLLELGFGRCSLQVAVPEGGDVDQTEGLDGRVVATSHPRCTELYLRQLGINVQLIEIKGAVEITPLLGIADAIADLVSTGSTLATNGLRPLATILDSQAELVANPTLPPGRAQGVDHIRMLLASVIAAKHKKYLMMNAPHAALDLIHQIIPGMVSPSVIPLADPEMVAVHAVVDSDQIWDLLGPLRQAGASSILVMPIEKLIP